jgi:hypothetical protein
LLKGAQFRGQFVSQRIAPAQLILSQSGSQNSLILYLCFRGRNIVGDFKQGSEAISGFGCIKLAFVRRKSKRKVHVKFEFPEKIISRLCNSAQMEL